MRTPEGYFRDNPHSSTGLPKETLCPQGEEPREILHGFGKGCSGEINHCEIWPEYSPYKSLLSKEKTLPEPFSPGERSFSRICFSLAFESHLKREENKS